MRIDPILCASPMKCSFDEPNRRRRGSAPALRRRERGQRPVPGTTAGSRDKGQERGRWQRRSAPSNRRPGAAMMVEGFRRSLGNSPEGEGGRSSLGPSLAAVPDTHLAEASAGLCVSTNLHPKHARLQPHLTAHRRDYSRAGKKSEGKPGVVLGD
jgi:hypothetical protein